MSKRWTIVNALPPCDLCGAPIARYDGATKMGPWAYMCHSCHATFGRGVGTGLGQRLFLERELDEWLKGGEESDEDD